jgi:hypothetical protein
MRKRIKLSLSARGDGTDAPTVGDLLDQVRDWFEILRGVEAAVAEDGERAIDWRLVSAEKHSPLALEFEAFPRDFAANVDGRAAMVARLTGQGLISLQSRAERPPCFSDKILAKAEKLFERVTNGLDLTEIDFGEDGGRLVITPVGAQAAARNAHSVLNAPGDGPYREIGSLEGFFQRVDRDGRGQRLLHIKHRLSGETVKCVVAGAALTEVEAHRIKEVWRNRRLVVFGTIHYRGLGRINYVDAEDVHFLRERSDLPDENAILDEVFTQGLTSKNYLEGVRNGLLS